MWFVEDGTSSPLVTLESGRQHKRFGGRGYERGKQSPSILFHLGCGGYLRSG